MSPINCVGKTGHTDGEKGWVGGRQEKKVKKKKGKTVPLNHTMHKNQLKVD